MDRVSMEGKLKHLEFIQNIITRMNSNSFSIKKWTIGLITILITIASSSKNINNLLILPYFLIISFWILDGYFLYQERLFRGLYNDIALRKLDEINFTMDIRYYNPKDDICRYKNDFINNTWLKTFFSKTLLIFYGSLIIFLSIILRASLIKEIRILLI